MRSVPTLLSMLEMSLLLDREKPLVLGLPDDGSENLGSPGLLPSLNFKRHISMPSSSKESRIRYHARSTEAALGR